MPLEVAESASAMEGAIAGPTLGQTLLIGAGIFAVGYLIVKGARRGLKNIGVID